MLLLLFLGLLFLLRLGFVSVHRSPFRFVRPVCCTHLATGDVLGMTSFKTLATSLALRSLWIGASSTNSLLTEPNQLGLVTRLGQHRMRLGRMVRCALGLVVPAEPFACTFYAHEISMASSAALAQTPAVVKSLGRT